MLLVDSAECGLLLRCGQFHRMKPPFQTPDRGCADGAEASAPADPASAQQEKPVPGGGEGGEIRASKNGGEKKAGTGGAWKKIGIFAGGIAAVCGATVWGIYSMNFVSTDDAYVNSHVTFVAPRVSGQVAEVFVDDNNRVSKGDLLVRLDKEPYEVRRDQRRAALDSAKADLAVAVAKTRGSEFKTKELRYQLERSIQGVDDQVAELGSAVAALEKAKADLDLAQDDYGRAQKLYAGKVTSQQEFDRSKTGFQSADAQFRQSFEKVCQIRAGLGLPAKAENGADFASLAEVPPDLDQTFSAVVATQAELLQECANLGVVFSSASIGPRQMVEEFHRRAKSLDEIYEKVLEDAPAVKQAQEKVVVAERDLQQAELDLRYCDILAEIGGVVTRRNVNPGNNVQAGQSLMAVRSLEEVWVDANFKETQLADLRIGLPVDLFTDMYGGKKVFRGRISGFTMGTGSTLALLPPQNATGNFVKVVQRLPVRIDVLDYDPDAAPLFVGISVTPQVHLRAVPTGPDAGRFLQSEKTRVPVSADGRKIGATPATTPAAVQGATPGRATER